MDRPGDDPKAPPKPSDPSHEDAPTIASRDSAPSDPDASTIHGARRPSAEPRPLPTTIGRYRILGKLGEGGMGIVFEAEQDSPRRHVALKLIRGGTIVDEVHVRMFEREVESLARLKHPNIAGIYDAGTTDAGEHYFAMELVRGPKLDAYLRDRKGPLDANEIRFRLRLFQSICAAVNYAHQRGVIHRDLKPSNIVISDAEGSGSGSGSGPLPEIKILDFGLARLIDSDAEAATSITEMGVIKGTLPYMSPEQARGKTDEIDLRSDVYALGVLLYEMLTGARPYDTHKASIMEAVRIICEQPPAPLSQSWHGSRDPDADLQTITGKALEKEADRRYESAAALADDVERYLDSRPILARAPSNIYKMRKFAQRNRALVAGSVATLLALVAGVIVSTTFGMREAAQRRVAEKAQKDTEVVAGFEENMLASIDASKMGAGMVDDLGARLAKSLRERGASGRDTVAALASFRSSMAAINSTDAALHVLDEDILARAIESSRTQFAAQPLLHARLLRSIGATYLKLGLDERSEAPLLASVALYDSVLGRGALDGLESVLTLAGAYMNEGRTQEAEPLMRLVLESRRKALGDRDSTVLESMNNLAMLWGDTGKNAASESLYAIALTGSRQVFGEEGRYTLSTMSNYAWTLTQDEKYAQAESLDTRALTLRRKVLGNNDAETMTSVNNLAVLYVRTGRPALAEPLYLEDYETTRKQLGDEHPDLLATMTNLGRLYNSQKKFGMAEAMLGRALATSRKVMPPGFMGTGITAQAYGEALVGLGRYREAEPVLLGAIAIMLPNVGPHHRGVQLSDRLMAEVCEHTGRPDQAAQWRGKLDPAK